MVVKVKQKRKPKIIFIIFGIGVIAAIIFLVEITIFAGGQGVIRHAEYARLKYQTRRYFDALIEGDYEKATQYIRLSDRGQEEKDLDGDDALWLAKFDLLENGNIKIERIGDIIIYDPHPPASFGASVEIVASVNGEEFVFFEIVRDSWTKQNYRLYISHYPNDVPIDQFWGEILTRMYESGTINHDTYTQFDVSDAIRNDRTVYNLISPTAEPNVNHLRNEVRHDIEAGIVIVDPTVDLVRFVISSELVRE